MKISCTPIELIVHVHVQCICMYMYNVLILDVPLLQWTGFMCMHCRQDIFDSSFHSVGLEEEEEGVNTSTISSLCFVALCVAYQIHQQFNNFRVTNAWKLLNGRHLATYA